MAETPHLNTSITKVERRVPTVCAGCNGTVSPHLSVPGAHQYSETWSVMALATCWHNRPLSSACSPSKVAKYSGAAVDPLAARNSCQPPAFAVDSGVHGHLTELGLSPSLQSFGEYPVPQFALWGIGAAKLVEIRDINAMLWMSFLNVTSSVNSAKKF